MSINSRLSATKGGFNGKASFVDESLFGTSKSAAGEKPQVATRCSICMALKLNKMRGTQHFWQP
ncbi:hypothetical protein HaLaN_01815 [Haematococcus lacustris]|uniref:Uncharacterized protein n=1 Tax=Haematococcus lacustris TaxID=44745 RepID=A0A699YCG4_HAELA|nr:hypothetical protein HaLaN_01815 [Haematococcus lacustris]